MSRPALLTLLLPLAACERDDACTADSAAADWIELRIDHTETTGDYVYTLETERGTNTCGFTAPLAGGAPACTLQGSAAEAMSDADGVTGFRAATSEGFQAFRATRDGEVLYDSELDPTWTARIGEKGCHLYDEGAATVSF